MRVYDFHLGASPLHEGNQRLSARLEYDGGAAPEELWFDVPDACAAEVSVTGNPWLAALFPLALVRPEPLRVERPVDPQLLKNLLALGEVWRAWYPNLQVPRLHAPRVEAELLRPSAQPAPTRSVAFFSGGVDSFATLRSHLAVAPEQSVRLDDLLYVWGFDLTLDQREAFERSRQGVAEVAAETGLSPLVMTTNLRQTLANRQLSWGFLHHGPALAAAALVLEGRFRHACIASTLGYRDLRPWGTHPLTDVLFSSSRTHFTHDASCINRAQKVEMLADWGLARRHLHVCWRSNSDTNCCRCTKCYRMMATLDVLGVLEHFPTLKPQTYDRRRLTWIYASPDGYSYLRDIAALARQRGRPDVARAMDRSIRRSANVDRVRRWLKRLKPVRGQGRLANLTHRWYLDRMLY